MEGEGAGEVGALGEAERGEGCVAEVELVLGVLVGGVVEGREGKRYVDIVVAFCVADCDYSGRHGGGGVWSFRESE